MLAKALVVYSMCSLLAYIYLHLYFFSSYAYFIMSNKKNTIPLLTPTFLVISQSGDITITNYLFRQNRTRNITKVILITHTKIPTLQSSCQGDCT